MQFRTDNPVKDAQNWISYLDGLSDNTTTENCADCDKEVGEFEQDGSPALHTQLISITVKGKTFERKIKVCTACKQELLNSGNPNLKFID